jgi:tetratricopeptide (TPR) repeat protein
MTDHHDHRSKHPARRLLAAALSTLLLQAAQAAPLDDMRRFVEGNQFEQAYALAMQNRQLIGDVHFDFLYGVAAIKVGKVPEGLLALERHLAAVPANDRARLELAAGYFQLGDYPRARAEFEFVLRYSPPAPVRATIARFLDAMQLRDTNDRRGTARAYAELGAGRDSNVNGGTFRDDVQFVFGNVPLQGSPSRAVADTVAQLAVGTQHNRRVTNQLSVFGGLDAEHKENTEHREFNLTQVAGNLGFSQLAGGAMWRMTLAGNALLVGGNRYRDTRSVALEASFTPSPEWQTSLFGSYVDARHQGADEVRDARITTVGASATRSFGGAGAPSAGIRVSFSQEDNLRLRPEFSRLSPLVRLFAATNLGERWRLSAGLTAIEQRYRAEDFGFGSVRHDVAANLDVVLSWAVTPGLTLRAEYIAYANRSNQDLYDSNRQSLMLKTRLQY